MSIIPTLSAAHHLVQGMCECDEFQQCKGKLLNLSTFIFTDYSLTSIFLNYVLNKSP